MRSVRSWTVAALAAALVVALQGCKKPAPTEEIRWPEEVEAPAVETPQAEQPPPPAEAAAPEEPAAAPEQETDASAAAAQAEAEPGEAGKAPDTVVLTPSDPKMGPVTFKHGVHKGLAGCKKCHHTMEPKTTPEACTTCHGKDGDAPDVKTAFHGKCQKCHSSMGAGPTKCNGCHKK